MLNIKQLQEESQTVESLKLITEALGDVATSKLKSTRKSMQQNIEFFQEIYQVYRVIKQIALKNKQTGSTATKLKHFIEEIEKKKNGKTVCLLLTSNHRFNGPMSTEITKYFLSQTKDLEADYIIVGALGKEFLETSKFTHKWTSIIFKEDFPSLSELKDISIKVVSYSKILVFHTQFVTVLNQKPTVTDVTSSDIQAVPQNIPLYYIVEPEIDKMLDFFENQIFILLFQAIFFEVELCRLASRMVAMNQAEDSAKKIIKDYKKKILQNKKEVLNMDILQTYAGLLRRD
jgi:F-type H+-transporting ATPase subunit gamma